jgi:hypothetical protein
MLLAFWASTFFLRIDAKVPVRMGGLHVRERTVLSRIQQNADKPAISQEKADAGGFGISSALGSGKEWI